MSRTTNYGLYLCDDSNEKFKIWREQMNGTDDSNMMKIDAALGEKADSSVSIVLTLSASGWEDRRQTISIEGITADTNGVIGIARDITERQLKAAYAAALYIAEQDEGELTIAVRGNVPHIDIPVEIIILG